MSAVLRICGAGDAYGVFYCPGCERGHTVRVVGNGAWGWNGDADCPTLTPSVLLTYNGADAGEDLDGAGRAPPAICHSFITDGHIRFLDDCTHHLVGQTVPLAPLPESYG